MTKQNKPDFIYSQRSFNAIFKFEQVNKEYYIGQLTALLNELVDNPCVCSNYIYEKLENFNRIFDVISNAQRRMKDKTLQKEYEELVINA